MRRGLFKSIGISIISLNGYSNKHRQTRYPKKRGAGPTCSSKARVGFADRAVEGGIPKESAKPYFPPRISCSESGAILPLVIILMLALTITGLAFLNAGVMENSLAMREIHKNQAFYLAEAGVEHARVKLGQDWEGWDAFSPISATLGAGTYNATVYNTDSSGGPLPGLPDARRRVTSQGTVSEITKTVEVILREPPTGSGIDSALTAGGDIVLKGDAQITPPPEPEDKFYDFELGDDPDDGLSLFEEIFGVTKDEMKAIAQKSPNRYYESAIKNDIVENITWVDGAPDQSEITTDTWSGSGIWIVNGDLKITGGAFDGILWVIGSLYLGAGNPLIGGAVFVECGAEVDTTLTGTPTVELDYGSINDALGALGTEPIVESWQDP